MTWTDNLMSMHCSILPSIKIFLVFFSRFSISGELEVKDSGYGHNGKQIRGTNCLGTQTTFGKGFT